MDKQGLHLHLEASVASELALIWQKQALQLLLGRIFFSIVPAPCSPILLPFAFSPQSSVFSLRCLNLLPLHVRRWTLDFGHSYPVALLPLVRAILPVRTSSFIPYDFSKSSRARIFSSVPVASTVNVLLATSTILARKISAISII